MIRQPQKIREYYEALLQRNSQYIGAFYVGVKTTNVFCISICRARKPKLENVTFYSSAQEALQHGFRPCKVCKPTENVAEPPKEVKYLMSRISDEPMKKISDEDLHQLGIAPEKVRRWFKAHHGITFHAYQRMIRLNTAYENLKKGHSVTTSAFGSGYGSLSGFGYTFKNTFKDSPENAGKIEIIYLDRFATPLGPMYAAATTTGICLLEFTDRKMLETEFEDLTNRLKAKIIIGKNRHIIKLHEQLSQYFDGTRRDFEIQLHTPGSDFQKSVWSKLREIPFGTTRSYKDQAAALGRPEAVRAVARANGQNRISIVIPCHRVIASNGSLSGYGGGLPRKSWLLNHEKNPGTIQISSN